MSSVLVAIHPELVHVIGDSENIDTDLLLEGGL